ncbi:unnamed protein product [Arabidopsis halleri]
MCTRHSFFNALTITLELAIQYGGTPIDLTYIYM